MKIERLFDNPKLLEKKYNFFISKKLLKEIDEDKDLIESHIEKAKHNMQFFDKNKDDDGFNDWLIVTLYYALYHSVLALIINKNYISKNHTASLIFLIKYYSEFKNDILLLHELSIKKEDAELYTELKDDRHKASYNTEHNFTSDKINQYKRRVTDFIHKTEEILQK